MPQHTFQRSILILSYHLLCLPTETLYATFLSPMFATQPVQHILLDLITSVIFGEEYRERKFEKYLSDDGDRKSRLM
jgi:hypothetical protein